MMVFVDIGCRKGEERLVICIDCEARGEECLLSRV